MSFSSNLTIVKQIGQGGFGDVYEGLDEVHGKVAVKVLRRWPFETEPDWQARRNQLLSEAQNLQSAKHKNVVNVLYVVRSQQDGNLHLALEFCDGGSLDVRYKAGPLKISETRKIATDVCLGLDAIHSRGMLHRDIKPGNIMLSGSRWKIGDFGLVTDGIILGYASAAGYMDHLAPEVHTDQVTSVKTDVWALGMTIYRLLHGDAFYIQGFAGLDVADLVKAGGFAGKLCWLPHIPKEWRKIIRKALHDESSLRFNSVLDLSQALGRLPITPDWRCLVSPNLVRWTLERKGRIVSVEWEVLSPRKHIWCASSFGGTRSRKLGGSSAPLAKEKALYQLENFLLSH